MSDKSCCDICCMECKNSVVTLSKCKAIMCLLCNFFDAGTGTMLSSSTCCNKKEFFCITLAMGFAQSNGGVIGWIWSIMYGLWMTKAADK